MKAAKQKGKDMFLTFARNTAKFLGNPKTFFVSVMLILFWAISGPFFQFSDTWQLIINTSTTIFTFLMVVILQHSSNHDAEQIDSKLNEIIALLNKDKLTKAEKKILDEHHEDIIEEAISKAKIENAEAELNDQDIND